MHAPTFRVLGPVVIVMPDGPITPRGRAARTVLAALLVEANHMVPYDRLAYAVWGEQPPRTWLRTLQTHVSHLRSLRGPAPIVRHGDAYRLQISPEDVDAYQFEDFEQRAHKELVEQRPETARRLCREALDLWRGPPFGDVADNEVFQLEVLRLEEVRMTVIEVCFAADLALGRHDEVIGALEAAVRQFPYRERLNRDLIIALGRCGRRTEAMDACRAYGCMIEEATGSYPQAELEALEAEIRSPVS